MEIVIAREEPGRRLPTIHRFSKTELLIGRGWHCDLVLVDEEIDGEHVRIVLDTESSDFLLEDLKSHNGTRVGSRSVNTTDRVEFGEPITVGQTTFTVNRAGDEVQPAIAHSNAERFLTRVSKPMAAILFAALAIAVMLLDEYLTGVSKFSWNSSMTNAMTLGAGMIMVALVGGGIAKLFKHKMRAWAHLWVLAVFAILTIAIGYLQRFIAFNVLNPSFIQALDMAVTSILLALWIGAALIISTNLRPRARNAIALIVVLGFITVSYVLPKVQKDDWRNSPQLQTTTMPPSLLVRGSEPPTRLESMIQSAIEGAREDAVERKIERDKKDADD